MWRFGHQRRYATFFDVRYAHILDLRTGWPVADAPHSVTAIVATV